jgi:hypothetical protein
MGHGWQLVYMVPSRPSGQLELGMGRDVLLGQDGIAVLGEHVTCGTHQE